MTDDEIDARIADEDATRKEWEEDHEIRQYVLSGINALIRSTLLIIHASGRTTLTTREIVEQIRDEAVGRLEAERT